jgi:hypothetical protein
MSRARDDVELAAAIVALLTATATAIYYAWSYITAPLEEILDGYQRGITAFAIGAIAAASYGVLWAFAEKFVLRTRYGPGIGGLPAGWEAVVLSFATTLPLTAAPPIWQLFTSKRVVLPEHLLACAAMIIGAAVGHVLLYGTKTPATRGLRNIIFPPETSSPNWGRAVLMELIYALVHFFSTVFTYQVAVHFLDSGALNIWDALLKTTVSGSIFFFGASATVSIITIADPQWLVNPAWVGVRGMANGTLLMIALTFGILM